MKRKSILFTMLASLFALSACGDMANGLEYINPYSEFYAIRYDTNSTADMTIDFSNQDGTLVQNIKKIDAFAPTWNFLSDGAVNYATLEQLKYMKEFKNESLRIDMAFGGGGIGDSDGIADGLIKDDNSWVDVNELSNALNKNGVLPYFVMLGIPRFAQEESGTQVSYPKIEEYEKFCMDVASYFKEKGQRVVFETWNEPDLNAYKYWTSGMPSFIEMNVAEAIALKKGNPDAYVVEQGLCWPVSYCKNYVPTLEGTYWDYYMRKTEELGNHIDALSWHYYGDSFGKISGCKSEKDDFSYYKAAVREAINRDNATYDLYTMTQHCTEFAHSKAGSGKLVATGLIPNVYEAIEEAYASTDISRFSWAYYVGSGDYALINPYSWKKTPSFYVHWSLGRLPLIPAQVSAKENLDETFGWKTGVDSHRASAIIYNKTLNDTYTVTDTYRQRATDSRNVNVQIKNVPFDAKSLKVYLIDNEHVAYTTTADKPYLIMDIQEEKIKTDSVTLDLKLPGNSAFYIEIDDGQGISELDEKSNLESHIVRKDYYYEERKDYMPYADMYENAFDASLGMLNHAIGKTAVMVTLDDMNEFGNLQLEYDVYGNLTGESAQKAIGVRIDYHTENGYENACNYYWRNYRGGFAYDGWGTGENATTLRSFGNATSGTYTLPLMQNAPSGWDGRIQITYYMVDAGKNVAATFRAKGVK